MTEILRRYEEGFGQKLNTTKTAIFFSRNTPPEEKEKILDMSGIPATQQYDKYLGLTSIVRKSRTIAFKSIIDRVWKCLQD